MSKGRLLYFRQDFDVRISRKHCSSHNTMRYPPIRHDHPSHHFLLTWPQNLLLNEAIAAKRAAIAYNVC